MGVVNVIVDGVWEVGVAKVNFHVGYFLQTQKWLTDKEDKTSDFLPHKLVLIYVERYFNDECGLVGVVYRVQV